MSFERFEFGYRPDNRWLHRKIDRARYAQLLRYFAIGVVLLAALVAAAWPRLEAVRLGYRVEQLRLERERLEKDVQRYRLELSQLTDPRLVERMAREHHGLEPPDERVLLEVAGSEALLGPGRSGDPATSAASGETDAAEAVGAPHDGAADDESGGEER